MKFAELFRQVCEEASRKGEKIDFFNVSAEVEKRLCVIIDLHKQD